MSRAEMSQKSQELLRTAAERLRMIRRSGAPENPPGITPEPGKHPKSRTTYPPAAAKATSGANSNARLPDLDPETIGRLVSMVKLEREGDQFARQDQWDAAVGSYVGSLQINPRFTLALYGMAECAAAAADVQDEITFDRAAIYASPGEEMAPDGLRESQPFRLMEFVLLLSHVGQSQESLFIYRAGASRLNYIDGKPHLRVFLPDFTEQEAALEPEKLQAMAYVCIAEDDGEHPVLADLEDAVRLWPTSAVANYYLGEHLDGMNRREDSRAAYQKAWQFGDEQVHSAMRFMVKFEPEIVSVLRANGQLIPGR